MMIFACKTILFWYVLFVLSRFIAERLVDLSAVPLISSFCFSCHQLRSAFADLSTRSHSAYFFVLFFLGYQLRSYGLATADRKPTLAHLFEGDLLKSNKSSSVCFISLHRRKTCRPFGSSAKLSLPTKCWTTVRSGNCWLMLYLRSRARCSTTIRSSEF